VTEQPLRRGPVSAATVDELTTALAAAIRKGLPLASVDAAGLLLNLKSVYARAVIPSEPASRLAALNELLPRLIATLSDASYRQAVQILFGLAGTRGTGLMERRRQAADVLGYNPTHFREEKERGVLETAAVVIQADLLRYQSRVKRASESLEPTGDTPSLGPEHLTHEEELVSRIWQHVYGLRAELIACARLSDSEGFAQQAEDHRQAALREEVALREVIAEYSDTYRAQLIRHGEAEFAVEALERLVGWRK
jgi:hypothetical protein